MIQNTQISNLQNLILFLQKEDNSYSHFILEKLSRDHSFLNDIQTQIHHIIPCHQGGPDSSWNLLILTIEEHAMAHQLLYENYNNLADLGASQMIRGQVKMGWATIRAMATEKMRQNKTGRFNSSLQRELGRRPKKERACYARNKYIVAALERGFTFQSCKVKDQIVTIGPFECKSLIAVMDKLMQHPQMVDKCKKWETCHKKEKHYAITALTRTLTGHVDKKTG